jgi:hypothetical protein
MRTKTQEAIVSAYIVSIGKRTPHDAAQDAAELCRLANSLNRLNEIACNVGLTGRQERRKQNLQTRIKAVLEQAGLVLNHFNNDSRGYAVYPPCTSVGRIRCFWRFSRLIESISSDLLTYPLGKLSAFWAFGGGSDRVMHL